MGNGNPFISVVTPVYNGGLFLGQCLEGWARQTYRNFELIFVDDGSDDDSVDIIEQYRDRLSLKVLRQAHQGISEATRRGVQEAVSNYIVLMDQDDIAVPHRLETTAGLFHEGAELIVGSYAIIDEYSKPTGKHIVWPEYIHCNNLLLEQFKRSYILGSAMAFKNKKDFSFLHSSHGATDFDISLKMLLNGYETRYVSEPLIHYRVHGNNTSANYVRQKKDIATVIQQYEPGKLHDLLISKGFPSWEVQLSLGICYLFQGAIDHAGTFLERALLFRHECRSERLLHELLFYSSVFFYKNGQYDSSYDLLMKLIGLGSRNPAVFNNIGTLLWEKGDNIEALRQIEHAAALNADYQDARKNVRNIQEYASELIFTERMLRETLTHSSIRSE